MTIQPIIFETKYNITIVGNLFAYNTISRSISLPAIIVGHPMGAARNRAPICEVEFSSGTLTEVTDDSPAVIRRFYDFYCTNRGWQRNPTTQRVLTTEVKFFNFYPLNDLNLIAPRPLLIVSGTQSHLCQFSEDTYRDASQPKELYWVPNAGHVDLYDRVNLIPFAKFTDFFRRNLARSA
ncbi:uncharacterized protein FRV6_15147 [Fusarium oxysporum]|uniref:AB hydrolase-1 domain-containing protein n=1 Tax=Fusarium oxysporum TaxID=5507 RepID=A0A2H3UAR0_FUSOX|nr:uncharacterized protein FRV6_15147 [Fusarium oxysporum]